MKFKILVLALAAVSLGSCSPNIVNTWNIDKYEVIKNNGQNTSAKNIGSITFKKKGKGTKNIHYNIFQNDHTDTAEFEYELHEEYIIINNKGKKKDKEEDSALNKTWIIVSDKSKKQIWKSTDGGNSVQVLELSR